MEVTYHSQFKKQYKKLQSTQKTRFAKAITLFMVDPYNLALYNHSLQGKWKGHRSISFGGDWRAHYIATDEKSAYFVAIGTHSQLYK